MKKITYSRQGDYQLPNITVPDEPEVHLGKYASLRRNYLKEQRYGIFISLLTQGKLNQHLMEVQEEAGNLMEQLTAQMAKTQNVTEELKAKDQMMWIGMMNNIRNSAEETVMKELIYS
ncbi:TnpV protein [[Clostridium] scindens]|uniref:TnpV protein n=2 Tax=Lachnospirales TaxID=3085636 RepID=A0A844FCK0_CLOSV|nr:TnpV protein [[Clostridium] scindens]MCI6535239.1 TnpV protein [Lachnospiraceae bacterium]MSS41245.1 TnpV protein [[Clostridium] scindens]